MTKQSPSLASSDRDPFYDDKSDFVTVTLGIRGWFAVRMWWNKKEGNFWEPWSTSSSSYLTPEEAEVDAEQWAEAEGIRFKSYTK